MNFNTIETLFNENNYEELIIIYKDDFESVDQYANLFSNNALVSPGECQESLTILTGLYMKFNTIYHIADYQYKKKEQISKISTGNKESLITADCYRIKMIFKAYSDNVKKGISSAQSLLKYWAKELELTR